VQHSEKPAPRDMRGIGEEQKEEEGAEKEEKGGGGHQIGLRHKNTTAQGGVVFRKSMQARIFRK
jgi:hypothetical protein